MNERLAKQLAFIVEVDQLKQVERQSYLADGSRRENSGEHSWHLALMACLLAEHATEELDLGRVVQMVLIHDLVEIDAGDTYCYDQQAYLDKRIREEKAATRLFNLLPQEQARQLRALWEEFEAEITVEARFAASLDRLQPLLLNYAAGGKSWREHGIQKKQVVERAQVLQESSPVLWNWVQELLEKAVQKGFLSE